MGVFFVERGAKPQKEIKRLPSFCLKKQNQMLFGFFAQFAFQLTLKQKYCITSIMNFENVKKYLDLRKYISFNILALIGLSVPALCLSWTGSVRSGEYIYYTLLILVFNMPILLILLITGIFEVIYKKSKYIEKENQTTTKKENKKPKLFIFFLLEIAYSILFTIGLIIPLILLFCCLIALLLSAFHIM